MGTGSNEDDACWPLSPEVSPASLPEQAAEYKLRVRGYSLVAVIFLNQKLERLNGQEDRSTSRKQVLPGKVTKKQNLSRQLPSLLVSELGCRQLGDLKNCHYISNRQFGEHIRCGTFPSRMMLGVLLHLPCGQGSCFLSLVEVYLSTWQTWAPFPSLVCPLTLTPLSSLLCVWLTPTLTEV